MSPVSQPGTRTDGRVDWCRRAMSGGPRPHATRMRMEQAGLPSCGEDAVSLGRGGGMRLCRQRLMCRASDCDRKRRNIGSFWRPWQSSSLRTS